MTSQDPSPVRLGDDVIVEDAFVNWQLNASNSPDLYAVISDSIPLSEFQPVECDPDDDFWLVESDYGLFYGWQTSLPVSEETGMDTTTVEHGVPKYKSMLGMIVCPFCELEEGNGGET